MTTYYATIRHHSISSARVIEGKSLASVKRRAVAEFGDGYHGHEIIVRERIGGNGNDPIVALRTIGQHRWN